MKPYEHKKLEEFPDLCDIKEEGRKSCVEKLKSKSGKFRSLFKNAKSKRQTRLFMKRADKAKVNLNENS